MSDRDELIAKARELDGSATSGPWRHDNVQHQNSVTSIERIITPWGLQFYDAQFIAESRTLLPALADLAESEGRRADDLDAEKRSMREILSELHKMLTRATDAGPCRITDLVQREIHERRAAMAQLGRQAAAIVDQWLLGSDEDEADEQEFLAGGEGRR